MPTTREAHVEYTRNELNSYYYYVEIFNILKKENIKCYLDIGANVGEFCKCMFNKLPTLEKAYLLEPNIENFNFMVSHTKELNVEYFNVGILYGNGKYELLQHNENVGGFQVIESEVGGVFNITTLESLSIPLVDLIKIDVEGGEFNIIENSIYLKTVKWLDIEWHDYNGTRPTEEFISTHLPMYDTIFLENNKNRSLLRNKNYE